MEEAHEVLQEPFRVERRFLIERHPPRVAAVDPALAEGAEAGVGGVVRLEGGEGLVLRGVVLQEPEIGIAGAVVDRLEREGDRAAAGVVRPEILRAGVGVEPAHRAAPAGDVPGGSAFQLHDERGPGLRLARRLLQAQVVPLDAAEQGIRHLRPPEEHAEEAHPFRPPEGRGLHVVGTFNDGDAELLDAPVAAAVLKGREQDGVRGEVHDALHVRVHRAADVRHAPVGATRLHFGEVDVLAVADAPDGIQRAQFLQEAAMDGGVDQRPLQGHAHDGAPGQGVRQGLVPRHQHVGVEDARRVPGVAHAHHGAARAGVHREERGVAHLHRCPGGGVWLLPACPTKGEKKSYCNVFHGCSFFVVHTK